MRIIRVAKGDIATVLICYRFGFWNATMTENQ